MITFASFVSFFPQLVAGPIERAKNLLPQIIAERSFGYKQGVEGLRLILWGLFKKVVIADGLAMHVNLIFDDYVYRQEYHFVEKYFLPSGYCGRQAFFVIPEKSKIDFGEIDADINRFRNVMD